MISLEDITCPISLQIFNDPVIVEDGNVYEREKIEEWLTTNSTSPATNTQISKKVYPAIIIKNMVNKYLLLNPDKKQNQYKLRIKVDTQFLNKFPSKSYDEQTNLIDTISEQNEFKTLVFHIFEKCSFNIIKYLVDNYEYVLNFKDFRNSKPIHKACIYQNYECIEYLINKKTDLNCENNDKWRPIHLACKYQKYECIKLFIDQNVELNCISKNLTKPIHYIFNFQNYDSIKLLLNTNKFDSISTSEKIKYINLNPNKDDIYNKMFI